MHTTVHTLVSSTDLVNMHSNDLAAIAGEEALPLIVQHLAIVHADIIGEVYEGREFEDAFFLHLNLWLQSKLEAEGHEVDFMEYAYEGIPLLNAIYKTLQTQAQNCTKELLQSLKVN